MLLTPERIQYLEEKQDRHERLSLEEVMELYYEKPCRRVITGAETGLNLQYRAERGSVIVTDEEVVVVCNPNDFHLWAPEAGYTVNTYPGTNGYGFKTGTTIITDNGLTVQEYLSPGDLKLRELQGGRMYRWGAIMMNVSGEPFPRDQASDCTKASYNLPGGHCRVITCTEELCVAARSSARKLKKALA